MVEFEKSLIYNINKSSKMLINNFNRKASLSGYDVNVEQLQILMVSYVTKGCIQQDLANILDKDKSAVLRSIDVLERKNIIHRTPSPTDKRMNIIQPTELGVELATILENSLMDFESSITDGIDSDELEIAIKVLQKIQDNTKCSQS